MAAPTLQAVGTAVGGQADISPAWPVHAAGDIGILVIESCGGEAANLSVAAGFAAVSNSPQSTGLLTDGTRLTAYWCLATSDAMTAPTVADPGDHVYGVIFTVRGCPDDEDPFSGTSVGGVKAVASNTVTITGMTTGDNNCRVIHLVSRDEDTSAARFSSPTGSNLSDVTEHFDAGTAQSNGGGFAIYSGTLAAAGATGNLTLALSTATNVNAFLTFALKPVDDEGFNNSTQNWLSPTPSI